MCTCKDGTGKQSTWWDSIAPPYIVTHNHPYISSRSRYLSKPGYLHYTLYVGMVGCVWLCRAL